MKKTISKQSLVGHLLNEDSSKDIAKANGCSTYIVTREIKRHFDGKNMRTVKKELFEKNGKYGTCKICNSPLKPTQSTYCSNKCKFNDDAYNESRTQKHVQNSAHKHVVCTRCRWASKDVNNLSGALTKHLKQEHNIDEPGNYNTYFKEANHDTEKTISCNECGWTTTDTENMSGALTKHIKNSHDMIILEYCEKHPNQKSLLNYEDKKRRTVRCKDCNKMFTKITYNHVKTHGYNSVHEYRLAHGLTKEDTYSPSSYEMMKRQYDEYLKGNGHTYSSKMETEIAEFIEDELNIECGTNIRSIENVSEIDVYIPSHNIGIEMNGLYYHSEYAGKKDKRYHYDKKKACHKQGINLIHIFEDQWKHKQSIIKHRLKHVLHHDSVQKTGARNTTIVENPTHAASFLNSHHIRGNSPSSYDVGLTSENNLVALMTFSKARRTDIEWDLNRFCTSHVVHGAASKCFNYFQKTQHPESIVLNMMEW